MNIHEFVEKYIDIDLYGYQTEYLEDSKLIANTDRAIGFTTLVSIKILYSIFTKSNQTIAIMGSGQKDLLELVLKLYRSIELDKPELIIESRSELKFSNNILVKVFSEANDIRGHSLNEVYIQEFALSKLNVDEISYVVLPSIIREDEFTFYVWGADVSGKLTQLSDYIKLTNLKNYFRFVTLPWYVIPDRKINWKIKRVDALCEEVFKSEYLGVWA